MKKAALADCWAALLLSIVLSRTKSAGAYEKDAAMTVRSTFHQELVTALTSSESGDIPLEEGDKISERAENTGLSVPVSLRPLYRFLLRKLADAEGKEKVPYADSEYLLLTEIFESLLFQALDLQARMRFEPSRSHLILVRADWSVFLENIDLEEPLSQKKESEASPLESLERPRYLN